MTRKSTFQLVAFLSILIFCGCSKKPDDTPAAVTPIDVSGTYTVGADKGSDNGYTAGMTTIYYSRTLTACELTALFKFNSDHTYSLTSTCSNQTGTWSFNSNNNELIVVSSTNVKLSDGSVTVTATGFIYDEITPFNFSNVQYTFIKK